MMTFAFCYVSYFLYALNLHINIGKVTERPETFSEAPDLLGAL